MHNIMPPLPVPRKINHLVAHALLGPLVQPPHVLGEPRPLALPLVAGPVALVGPWDERQVRLRGDLERGVRGAGGREGGEDARDGGELVVFRHLFLSCFFSFS